MRWLWIDKFVEFESGQRAVAIKNVTLAEPHVSNYLPGRTVLPASLVIEGLAQTGGVLVAEANRFEQRVVLAKISSALFQRDPVAGDTLRYTATIEQLDAEGAIVLGDAHVEHESLARVKLVFAHLGNDIDAELFKPSDLLRMLRLWNLSNVIESDGGRPLSVPSLTGNGELEHETTRSDNRCGVR